MTAPRVWKVLAEPDSDSFPVRRLLGSWPAREGPPRWLPGQPLALLSPGGEDVATLSVFRKDSGWQAGGQCWRPCRASSSVGAPGGGPAGTCS